MAGSVDWSWLHRHATLLMLGFLSECIYVLYFVRRFPLLPHYRHINSVIDQVGTSREAFALYVLQFVLLFVLLVLAWREVRGHENPRTIWFILGTGAVFAGTLVFVSPITAPDLYLYLGEGRLLVQYHQNPLVVALASHPGDPFMLPVAYVDRGSPYGPTFLLVEATLALLSFGNLLVNLLAFKIAASAFLLLDAFLAYRILQQLSPLSALGGALLVAWNPLLLFQVAANGHNDGIMMLFVLLGLLLLGRSDRSLPPLFLLLSMLVKYASGLLLPLLLARALMEESTAARRVRYVALTLLQMSLLAFVLFAPFWAGARTFHWALAADRDIANGFGETLSSLVPHLVSLDQATFLGRLLFAALYGYALRLSLRDLGGLLMASFLVMFGAVALAGDGFRPWYIVWPVILAALLRGPMQPVAALSLSFGAVLGEAAGYFLWPIVTRYVGISHALQLVFVVAYTLTFVLPGLALVATWLAFRRPRGPAEIAAVQTPTAAPAL